MGGMLALFMHHHRIVRCNVECVLNHAANSELRVTVTGSVRFMLILCIAYGDCLKMLKYFMSVLRVLSDAKNYCVDSKLDPLVYVLF